MDTLKIDIKCTKCNTVLDPDDMCLYHSNRIENGASYDEVVIYCNSCSTEHIVHSHYKGYV